ncbi:hypothetical protein OsJ_29144 [Oryza sativa Japonica Group]|uniref:Protein kinase domain-containing protein n=1 Tax=Oryza sativa subsp. japonica TaxID=39947 RepID=B9G397_ORYSJ|nr:hypothetical protein OsJ_29144 [Oryza sativa Japonica Group]
MKSQQGHAFKIFSEEELQQATKKFNEQEILGQGGNGIVYKGLLKSNSEVAVKKCMTIDEQKKKEFGKEMLILSQTNHKNIVKLLGCCLEVEVPCLCTSSSRTIRVMYSFGVVLLELLTRKKACNLDAPEHEKVLSMMFLSAMKENKLEDMLNDQIKNNENMEFLEEMAELARKCLDMSSINRPSMKEIGDELGRLRKVMEHQCARQNPEEMESFLGDSSM